MIKQAYKEIIVMIAVISALCTSQSLMAERTKSDFERFADIVLRRTLGHKVDPHAEFVGQGLSLPVATRDLSWLFADWDSIAQHVASTHSWKSDTNLATFSRSYEIPDGNELGFVWKWQYGDQEVFFIMHAASDAGWDIRLVLNTHKITLDEAILASYFNDIRQSYRPFEVTKWTFGDIDAAIRPDALSHLGESFLSKSDYFTPFTGQIITVEYASVRAHNDTLLLTPDIILPTSFTNKLPNAVTAAIETDPDSIRASFKFQLRDDGQIVNVIAAAIDRLDNSTYTPVYRQAVPTGHLGEGSLPLD